MTTLSAQTLAAGDPDLPLHRRLADALEAAIRRGDFSPTDPLPSESDIARDCDVALGTVRQAMSHLRESGLIERRQGRGTFIRRADFSRSLLRFFRFGGAEAEVPQGAVLTSQILPADEATASALDRPPGEGMLRLDRIRHLGGRPAVHEELWLPLPEFARLAEMQPEDLPNLLYPYFEECCGILVARACEELTLSEATAHDAELLECPEGEPIMAIERVATAIDGRPIERRLSRGSARTFRYRVEIS